MTSAARIVGVLAGALAVGSCQGIVSRPTPEPLVERQGAATTCDPRSVTTVATVAYDYDLAGRQTRDRDARLVYDPWNQLKEVQQITTTSPKYNDGRSVVPEKHTYGFDGTRTSTTTNPGAANVAVRVLITPDDVIHDGKREHYVRIGSRIVARLAMTASGTLAAAPLFARGDPEKKDEPATHDGRGKVGGSIPFIAGLALLILAFALAAFSRLRSRRWPAVVAAATVLVGASCEMFAGDSAGHFSKLLLAETTYFHASLGAGPSLITRQDGTILEERRFEPFGVPIDAFRTGRAGAAAVDFIADPQSIVGQTVDPANGFSDHGARWFSSQSGRWLTPDPAVLAAGADYVRHPWDLNPYSYVRQNPTTSWDPDGRQPVEVKGRGTRGAEGALVLYEYPEARDLRFEEWKEHQENLSLNRTRPEALQYNAGPLRNAPEIESSDPFTGQLQPLQVGQIDYMRNFNRGSRGGDEFEGHELFQYQVLRDFLKSKGLSPRQVERGSRIWEIAKNPAIALTPEQHRKVNAQQRELGLNQPDVLQRMGVMQSILKNREALEKANVVPKENVEAAYRMAIRHAEDVGAIPGTPPPPTIGASTE